MSDGEKKLASPFSTVGGEKLQDLVGAYYLAATPVAADATRPGVRNH